MSNEWVENANAEQLRAMLYRYKQALEGLTPGGSEYVNEPERCATDIRDKQRMLHEGVITRQKKLNALEGQ